MIELRINEILKEKKMTMVELAQKIGINRVNLYNSLNTNPTYSRLEQVAQALNVDIADLFKKNTEGVSINGYIEVNEEIYKVTSIAELKELIADIEEGLGYMEEAEEE